MKTCDAPGCTNTAEGRNRHCTMHRSRLSRLGTLDIPDPRLTTDGTCQAPDCTEPIRTRGLCTKHYGRHRRLGTLDLPPTPEPPAECEAPGCTKPPPAGRHCTMHAHRLRTHGSYNLPPEPPRLTECTIDGCTNPPRSAHAEHCEMHYYRMRRYGTITIANWQRPQGPGPCIIDGCTNLDQGHTGYCNKHQARVNRHGNPHTVTTVDQRRYNYGPANPVWKPAPSYGAIHSRLIRTYGPATTHTCHDCGQPADHWTYDHQDPDELPAGTYNDGNMYGPYSLNPNRYQPRCISCHRLFDNAHNSNQPELPNLTS